MKTSMKISISESSVKMMTISETKNLSTKTQLQRVGEIITVNIPYHTRRCTCAIKCRIATAKAAFNKRDLFTSTLDLELRKKPVKCYIWSIALHGAETWTLRAVDQKHLRSFEMWCCRRMENISWTNHV